MNRPTFKRLRRGDRLSAKELNLIRDTTAGHANSLHTQSYKDSSGFHTRRQPSVDAGEAVWARVIQSLRRPDPTTDPPVTAITHYKIKFLTAEVLLDWDVMHGTYLAGGVVEYDGLDYECLITHYASEATSPTNATYWTCISTDAWILGYHYSDDLLPTCPWYQVGDIVEVVYRDNTWRIHGTVSKVEHQDYNKLSTSQSWNPLDKRAMAVYK